VALLANIGTADDASKAAKFDLEGSGLFRTEFLFLDRDSAPTLEEQTATYTSVFESFGKRRVVVRTLDAGADKPLSFADLGPEENPGARDQGAAAEPGARGPARHAARRTRGRLQGDRAPIYRSWPRW